MGFERKPYSLHPYQYGYSNPTLYTDPSGNWPEHYGWGYVRELAEPIRATAKWHIPPGRSVHGFTWQVLAILMGARIALESNLGERAGRRLGGDIVGDVTHNDPSTRIANIRPSQAIDVYNDPCIQLMYQQQYDRAVYTGVQRYIDDIVGSTPVLEGPEVEHRRTRLQRLRDTLMKKTFYHVLQNNLYTLDLTAGRFLQAIYKIAGAGRKPSVFMVSNYLQNPNGTTLPRLLGAFRNTNDEGHIASGGGHGIEIIENLFNESARILNIPATLPNGLEFYNSTIQPGDDKIQLGTEKEHAITEREYRNWLVPQVK